MQGNKDPRLLHLREEALEERAVEKVKCYDPRRIPEFAAYLAPMSLAEAKSILGGNEVSRIWFFVNSIFPVGDPWTSRAWLLWVEAFPEFKRYLLPEIYVVLAAMAWKINQVCSGGLPAQFSSKIWKRCC